MPLSKQKGKDLSDKEYWKKCCQGDEQAMFCIHERYRIQLFGIAYAMTKKREIAQQVLQEVFAHLYQKSQEKYPIKNIKSFLTDLTKTLSNRAI